MKTIFKYTTIIFAAMNLGVFVYKLADYLNQPVED